MLQHEEKARAVELAIDLAILQGGRVHAERIRKNLPMVLPLLYPIQGRQLTPKQLDQALRILARDDSLHRSDREVMAQAVAVADLVLHKAEALYDQLGDEFKMGGSGVREEQS